MTSKSATRSGTGIDIAIRKATVCDGSGRALRSADVGLAGDRIVAVDDVPPARREVDAAGLLLTPGFVDVHSHDDFAVLVEPEMAFKVAQGVTTCVVGNCGLGVVPYDIGVQRFRLYYPDASPTPWSGFGEYFNRVTDAAPTINVAVLVGHGSLRRGAMGVANRAPSRDEMRLMQGWLEEGIDAGVSGLSSGLVYEPGRYASAQEIVQLAQPIADAGGIYTTHIRNEAGGLLDSIAEAIAVGRATRVPLQVSHLKASGHDNCGRVKEALRLMDDARQDGLRVSHDAYPYTAASTYLSALKESLIREDGSMDGEWGRVSVSDVLIASCPPQPVYEGRRLSELAEFWRVGYSQARDRLLTETGDATFIVLFAMCEEDVQAALTHPAGMIGSDGVPGVGAKPHPRLFGTFPRVLSRYVRESQLFTLPEVVRRMTSLPAQTFGLANRGLIEVGAFADLVLLDPNSVKDRATYDSPQQTPEGIHKVFVNGQLVVDEGHITASRPGRVLRRSN